jgi:hypothetical protein
MTTTTTTTTTKHNIHTAPTLNNLDPVALAPEALVVNASELTVVYLNAGNDSSGNPRRLFVLSHPTAGWIATADEGYAGRAAIADFKVEWHAPEAAQRLLRDRITPCIECSPSYRRRLLSAAVQANLATRYVIVVGR